MGKGGAFAEAKHVKIVQALPKNVPPLRLVQLGQKNMRRKYPTCGQEGNIWSFSAYGAFGAQRRCVHVILAGGGDEAALNHRTERSMVQNGYQADLAGSFRSLSKC